MKIKEKEFIIVGKASDAPLSISKIKETFKLETTFLLLSTSLRSVEGRTLLELSQHVVYCHAFSFLRTNLTAFSSPWRAERRQR